MNVVESHQSLTEVSRQSQFCKKLTPRGYIVLLRTQRREGRLLGLKEVSSGPVVSGSVCE